MGSLGIAEITVILVAAFLLFGPRRLPGIARKLGEAMREFTNLRDRAVNIFRSEHEPPDREDLP